MTCLRLLLLVFLASPPVVPGAEVTRYLTGNPADAPAGSVRAGYLLSGGGGDVDEAFRWFAQLAGGGDVVVLRASGGDGYNDYLHRAIGGFDSVESIVFPDAASAHDPAVVATIEQAEAIFLAGGDQARYVRFWRGTPVGAALARHIAAGRPIGGTSAGLTVLGEFYFPALHDTIDSAAALADPFDPRIELGSDFLRIPVLAGVLTDSHFMARERLGRLLVFLARLQTEHPDSTSTLVGLGIDERTALCVEADGTARVLSNAGGRVWLVQLDGAPALVRGQPGHGLRARVTALDATGRLHLPSRQVTKPAEERTFTIERGQLITLP